MALFRCNGCGHIREVGDTYLGKAVKCPKCKISAQVHDTTRFVRAIVGRFLALKEQLAELQPSPNNESADLLVEGAIGKRFADLDVHNTNILAAESNLAPLAKWFEERQIGVQFDPSAADTTGFFDEIALMMGRDYALLSNVSSQIKRAQFKGFTSAKIDVSKFSKEDLAKIRRFCSELYDYSFVAKNFHHKEDQIIWLTLQTAPTIRDFFNGYWMEWYVLITLLEFFASNERAAACARSAKVTFRSGKSNELDVFVLSNNDTPICIERKTGEFRQDIDKYLSLRKQLGLAKAEFVLCVFGLSTEQAAGMTSMYDLTFVNELTLMEHVASLLND